MTSTTISAASPAGPPVVGTLDGRTVRPSSVYRLVPASHIDELSNDLGGLLDLTDGEAVLVPTTGAAAGVKLIDPATVALLSGAAPCADTSVLQALVLDGILTIDTPAGPRSGPHATDALFPIPTDAEPPSSPLAALSRSALERASRRVDDSPAALAAWLYSCNTVPMAPRWAGLAGRVEQRLTELDLDRRLAGYESATTAAWAQWRRPDADPTRLTRKLYVSPGPADLAPALAPIVESFVETGARALKVGRGPYGPLRPDKVVGYFDDHARMLAAADRVASALDGVGAQGVPFTAAAGGGAIVSWGIDPPREARLSGWDRVDSWRSWITNRLGRLVADAVAARCSTDETLVYANRRIELDGVDPTTWTPRPDMWIPAGGRP